MDTLERFRAALAEMESPSEAVGLWIRFRPALRTLSEPQRRAAWAKLCERTTEVGGMDGYSAWLKRAVDLEVARRGLAGGL